MPCYYTGSREGDLALSLEEARTQVTRLTRMLCEANKHIDEHSSDYHYVSVRSPELDRWWKEHKVIDRAHKNL